jgi:energy-coupling factor transport system permease protein
VLAIAGAVYALCLKRYRLLMAVYGIVAGMWCMAVGMMAGLHALWSQAPALEPVKLAGPFLRTLIIVDVSLVLALSTPVQDMMTTLKTLRLPFCLYVPVAVMVRFLPAFIEDIRLTHESMRLRGHRLSVAGVIGRPLLTLRLMLSPLLIRSLRSADELGMAAELKGIGRSSHFTPLKKPRFGSSDALAAGLTVVLMTISVILQVIGPDSERLMF